ncbi:MAG: UDP-glucose 4-epimerase GalE [Candidatus Methylacidiphilales bacterium]
MKLLVVGGAGYIGSFVVRALLEGGHEVSVLDNLSTGSIHSLDDRSRFIERELSDPSSVLSALRESAAERVVHCAGLGGSASSLQDPGSTYQSVIQNGLVLLEAMQKTGCGRLVVCSSSAVYGLPEKMPVDERTPLKPITPYGHALVVFEQILQWYQKIHSIGHVSLRLFNVAGATETMGEWQRSDDRLISRMIAVALGASESVPVWGDSHATPDGSAMRDFVHVVDVAEAVLNAVQDDRNGTYNIGSGEGTSVLQALDFARKETGHAIPARIMPPRPGEPPRLVAAFHRAKMDWHWQPKTLRFHDIFRTSWKWALAHPEIYKP